MVRWNRSMQDIAGHAGKWLDGWLARWIDGGMDGWLDGWMAGWTGGWIDDFLTGWMHEWAGEKMDGWLAGWMDGTLVTAHGTFWMLQIIYRWLVGLEIDWLSEWTSHKHLHRLVVVTISSLTEAFTWQRLLRQLAEIVCNRCVAAKIRAREDHLLFALQKGK